MQKAYLDFYKKLPVEDGIDVLSVGGLAFARYCELAKLINKQIVIVTDNDGDASKVIEKFNNYSSILTLCVETNDNLNTLEPSVLEVNKDQFDKFKRIIYRGNSDALDCQGLLDFMSKNKTEWSMRVFQSEQQINYPKYILKAIGANINE